MEDKPKLESASFEFSQNGNCLVHEDEAEFLTIECESSLGIDRDEECFFILKTKKWSIDSAKDLQDLFDRINKVIISKTKNKIK
jgi:hypothetical protein